VKLAAAIAAFALLFAPSAVHGQGHLDYLRNAAQHTWACDPATGPAIGYLWAIAPHPCEAWRLFAFSPTCRITIPIGPEWCVKVRAISGWEPHQFGPWSEHRAGDR